MTVDSTTNQNVIAWEKPFSDLIDRFIVYKETNETVVYEPLGTVDYDSPAVFTDTNSNPAVKSYRYKLGFTDAAGRPFPASDFHQSIHLSINQGVGSTWNLIWTSYLGVDVASYNIYRSVNGEQYSQIASISSSFNSYTDLTVPQGNIHYIDEVPNPDGCEVQLRPGSYTSSLSNAATNNFLDVEEDTGDPISGIYPNPADQGFALELNRQASEEVTVGLYDLTGRNIYSREPAAGRSSSVIRFSTPGMPDGVYMLKVLSGSSVHTRKVIVKH